MTTEPPAGTEAEAIPAAPPDPGAESPTGGRYLLLLASAGGALSNFGILFLAARSLGVVHNAEFLVFWGLLFGLFGVQSGIQNETVRATSAPSPTGARVMRIALVWGGISAGALLLTSPLWAPAMLPLSTVVGALALIGAALIYPVYVTLVGALGGSRRWDWYGGTLLIEVGLRVVLVIAVALLGGGLEGFELASTAAVSTVGIVLLLSAVPRRAAARRADVSAPRLLRNGGLAMVSTACTALLVTAYPALVQLTTTPERLGLSTRETATIVGACLLAISLTRAPIMMPLTAFVGVAISAFTEHRGGIRDAVGKPFALLAAAGLLGAAAAWPIGPWFLRLFKPEYGLPGWYFAALTAASVLMAWLTILGALALALSRHGLYIAGWGAASVVAVACLLLPLPLVVTTSVSLAVGPAVGCAVLLAALARRPAPP